MSRAVVRERHTSRFEYSKVRARFDSGDEECVGWLYRPDRPQRPPVIVMAGDFATERTWGLPTFAERFAERGYAVFLFDYRHFGDSEGEPRNLVNPSRQVDDWRAAIGAVRELDDVDTNRLALWGVGLAGGHVLEIAADDSRVSAVVAQSPIVDGRSLVLGKGPVGALKAIGLGLRDKLQSFVTGPYTVPVVGNGEEFAALGGQHTRTGVRELIPDGSYRHDRTPARVFLSLLRYRPVSAVEDVTCPALLLGGTKDDIAPVSAVESAAEGVENGTFVRLPSDHFGTYHGAMREQALGHQFAFLDANL